MIRKSANAVGSEQKEETMFKNPGGKLKALAKVFFWLQILLFTVGGIYIMSLGDFEEALFFLLGILAIGVGVLIAWLSTIMLYAFGELVESNTQIKELLGGRSVPMNAGTFYNNVPR